MQSFSGVYLRVLFRIVTICDTMQPLGSGNSTLFVHVAQWFAIAGNYHRCGWKHLLELQVAMVKWGQFGQQVDIPHCPKASSELI
jgi:hypothetical protein